MQDFINPKSMLTPGVAGSLMMFLVNGIVYQFPELSPRYLALSLSFLLGSIVWVSRSSKDSAVLEKLIFWILNSLVIFVVGFGATNIAADATGTMSRGLHQVLSIPFISSAFAQDETSRDTPSSIDSVRSQPTSSDFSSEQARAVKEELKREQAKNEQLRKQLDSLQRDKAESIRPQSPEQFFKRW